MIQVLIDFFFFFFLGKCTYIYIYIYIIIYEGWLIIACEVLLVDYSGDFKVYYMIVTLYSLVEVY